MGGCESPGARILLRGEYYCVGITTAWGWAGLLHQRQGVGGGVGEGWGSHSECQPRVQGQHAQRIGGERGGGGGGWPALACEREGDGRERKGKEERAGRENRERE